MTGTTGGGCPHCGASLSDLSHAYGSCPTLNSRLLQQQSNQLRQTCPKCHQPFDGLIHQCKPAPGLLVQDAPHDPVNAPLHHTKVKPPYIEVVEGWQLSFHLGQVIKYIARHPFKNGLEDLEKALWHLTREVNNQKESKKNDK